MTTPGTVAPSAWPSLLALGLVGAGVAAGVADGWSLVRHPGQHPVAFESVPMWPLWAGVILSVSTPAVYLWARYIISLLAIAAAGGLVAMWVQGLVHNGSAPGFTPAVLNAGAQMAAGGLLAAWGVWDVLRRRRLQLEGHAVQAESQGLPLPAFPDLQPLPVSPTTPVTSDPHPRQSPAAPDTGWRTVATPYPRAVEDDPDGTVLRPPKRRR